MNPIVRTVLILGVIGAAVAAAWRYTPHHVDESVFTTLYMHVVPAPLVEDPHHAAGDDAHVAGEGAHGGHDWLLSVPLPGWLGAFDMDAEHEGAQLLLTNLQIFQVAAAILCLVCFAGVAGAIRSGRADALTRFFAGWAMWIRDEMVVPVMGREMGGKFLPFFLSLFFFVVFMNLLGLVPMSATATASIYVTGALAAITLASMIFGGMAAQGPIAFWKNLVPHVPLALWPLMFVIELVGLFIKPFALMIRLFANMTGGHMVVLSFMGLIFFFGQRGEAAALGWASAPVAVLFAGFIMIIEVFVALLQAYIFTQLSILFIGASIHPEH